VIACEGKFRGDAVSRGLRIGVDLGGTKIEAIALDAAGGCACAGAWRRLRATMTRS
jgi:hypothetical protein